MTDNPAKAIIDFLGGARAVSTIVGKHPSRVYRWTYPDGKRQGFSGLIPAREQVTILNFCVANQIDLQPADFFNSARLMQIMDSDHSNRDGSHCNLKSKVSNSPAFSSAGDAGVQPQSPRSCTPVLETAEPVNDRL